MMALPRAQPPQADSGPAPGLWPACSRLSPMLTRRKQQEALTSSEAFCRERRLRGGWT